MTEGRLTVELDQLRESLVASGAPVAGLFRPPRDVPAIVEADEAQIELDPSVVELYGWSDGIDDPGGTANVVFPLGWWFPPYERSLESCAGMLDELSYWPDMPYWRRHWFPVMQSGLSSLAVAGPPSHGEVWLSSIELTSAEPVADSLVQVVARIAAAFDAGIFYVLDGMVQLRNGVDEIAVLRGDTGHMLG